MIGPSPDRAGSRVSETFPTGPIHGQQDAPAEWKRRGLLLGAATGAAALAATAAGASAAHADPPSDTCREIATRAEVETTTIPATQTFLRTAGYASAGDGGDALYRRVATEPDHQAKVQSEDGAWWSLVYSIEVRPQQFGAVNDNSTDCTSAFQNMFDFVSTLGSGVYAGATVHVPAGRYRIDPVTISAPSCRVIGDGLNGSLLIARTAGQSHVLHFTAANGNTEIRSLEVWGWDTVTEPDNFAEVGLRFDGSGPTMEDFRVAQCGTCVWSTKGSKGDIRNGMIGNYTEVGIHLGGVEGSAIAETMITALDIYSGAPKIQQDATAYGGVGIKLDSFCAATYLEHIWLGSNVIAIEIVDSLGSGNARAPGHVNVRRVNMGRCRDAGLWIKNNGSSLNAVASRFSADGAADADGLRVDSPNAGVLLYDCGWHWCRRSGIRVTDGGAVIVNGGTFREIGTAGGGAPGVGVLLADGAASVSVQGANVEADLLQSGNDRDLESAVRIESPFSGVVDVMGCRVVDATGVALRNDSSTATLNTQGNLIR